VRQWAAGDGALGGFDACRVVDGDGGGHGGLLVVGMVRVLPSSTLRSLAVSS
jgi:hypothetical protein